MPEAAAGLDAPEADAGAAGEFDFRTAARFAGEGNGNGNGSGNGNGNGNGEWSPLHPRALPGAAGNGAPGGDARLKALKEAQKQQQQQMWKWPLYPGTPARNFAQSQPQPQPAVAMAEKRAVGVEAPSGGNVPQRFGAVKFNTAIAVKPPRSKWDDAEKWLVNTGAGDSPAHPQQQQQLLQQQQPQQQHLILQQQQQQMQVQVQLQSKYLRARGGGSSSIAESSDGETGSSRTAEFVFPTAGAGAVPAATSPPPRHKQLLQQPPRRNAGTGMSGRFFSAEDVPKRSARPAAEQEAEAEAGGSALLDAAEDGIGSSMGSEAFKDKFADSVVEQQPQPQPQSPQAQEGQIVVSHRDMGTQMTPIPSQRASRCATPGRANSPSRHNTPSRRSASLGSICLDLIELQTCHLAKLELRQLSEGVEGPGGAMLVNGQGAEHGSSNWSTKEEEEAESSKRLRQIDLAEVRKSVIEARTAAWQEAEQAKYLARFKREEVKIQAWENHKRAQAEAEMKRIEVKLEKMRSHANEKAMNRLVSAHRKAEDMRAMAQAKRSEAAAKTVAGAQQIRQTGRIPHRPSCFSSSCAS